MKKLMTLMLMMALAIMATGCVQVHMDTEIEKDGSGTMEMTMSLSKVVSDVLKEEAADDDLAEIGDLMKMEKKEIEEKIKGHDVKIKKFKKSIVNERETLEMAFEFKSLEGLSYALNQTQGEGSEGMAIVDLGDGNYALKSYEYNWPAQAEEEEEEEEEEMNPEDMQKQMELMGKLMGAMGELEFSMKITVPGDIVESNAPVVEGRTSIWNINSSNMMTAGGDMEPNIVFSGKGLKIKDLKK